MKHKFSARIYKVGINPCVKVPHEITDKMKPVKGYIPVRGKIEKHDFTQTLVPVKNSNYRLYVNGPMLEGGNVKLGDVASFTIEQFARRKREDYPMIAILQKELNKHGLKKEFDALTEARKKDILKYLNSLKPKGEALAKNVAKVISMLKSNKTPRIP
jgi:hypothetical protein